MAFTVIKASTASPLTSFNLDGLEYARSVYIVDYKNIQQTAEVIDTSLVQVGIKDKHTDKNLIFPKPFNLWSNDGTTPYASLDALLVDLAVFLGFNRVAGGSATEGNDAGVIYILGDENTDGSLRLVPDVAHEGSHVLFEYRSNGSWNRSGVDLVGDTSVNLGANLEIGAMGNHLRGAVPSLGAEFTHPHRHFSDTGSKESTESINLGTKVIRSISQPDDSGEVLGSSIAWTVSYRPIGSEAMIDKMYLKVLTGATGSVNLKIHRNSAEGQVFYDTNFTAADFAIGEIGLDIQSHIEDIGGVPLFFDLTVTDGTIGMAFDISGTFAWIAFDFHPLVHEHNAPMEFAVSAIVIDATTHENIITTTGSLIAECPTLK